MNKNDMLTEQCLPLISAGDQRAFRQLFDHYAERLSVFAFSILKNREAAMEVVDEIFVRLWKQREHVSTIHNIRTYLYTAVKNAALNYLSAKANRQITEPFDFINIQLQDDRNPEQQLITTELFSKIHSAVEQLPPRCKMIFKLVREDGLRYKEVADILNLSVNTVDAQMVIAVKRISEKVKADFDFYPAMGSRKAEKA